MTYLSLNRLSYIFTAKEGASIIFTHNKQETRALTHPLYPSAIFVFILPPGRPLILCASKWPPHHRKSPLEHVVQRIPTAMAQGWRWLLKYSWTSHERTPKMRKFSGRLRESTKREKKGSKLHYYFLEDNSLHAISKLCISVVSCCSSWASQYIQRRETISIHTSRDRLQEVKSNWK